MDNSESLLPDASTVNNISRGSLINMKKIGAGETAHTHTHLSTSQHCTVVNMYTLYLIYAIHI